MALCAGSSARGCGQVRIPWPHPRGDLPCFTCLVTRRRPVELLLMEIGGTRAALVGYLATVVWHDVPGDS
jgi:hypothetical protein